MLCQVNNSVKLNEEEYRQKLEKEIAEMLKGIIERGVIFSGTEKRVQFSPYLFKLDYCPFSVLQETKSIKDYSQLQSLILELRLRMKYLSIKDRRKFLMESFIPMGDPMLPETLWDIYSKWQVGSRGAIAQYIVGYFQKAMEKSIGFKSPQVKIIDDKCIQAIFSFERRGVEYFDGWEIYRTGEDEYYIKTVMLPEALAPVEIKSPQTPKPISILLALQKKYTIGHKIKPKSSIPIEVRKKRKLSRIKPVFLIIVSGCICIIVEIILMAIIVNHNDNLQKIQKLVVTEPKRYEQEQDNQGMTKSLIRKGANVNVQSQYGDTPLHKAARLGDIFKIKQLLGQGADINAQDKQKDTPLHMAAYHGKTEVILLLIRMGADTNARNSFEETPLFYAASQGKTEAASLLIQQGANINERDLSKNTPLHYAASHGNLEIVRLLIQKGADINAQNIRRETPLHLAVYWGHKEVSVLLEQRSAVK